MPTLLITGSNGQVGQELQYWAKQYPHFKFIFTDVAEMDITNIDAITQYFKDFKIDYCINCAAYTAVDKAESNEEIARKINKNGAENLAKVSAAYNVPFVQISTDFVYHNGQNTPFKEGDVANPQGVYAATKLEGDIAAMAANPQTLVLRTSWVYSSYGHNFVKTMIRLGTERDKLTIIFDQIGTPTYARDLAKAILDIIDKVEKGEVEKSAFSDLYHYSNEGVASWYDFAKAVFDLEDIECNVSPIETKDYPTPAKRPHFSLMNKGKIKSAFDISIPYWRDSLKDCLVAMKSE